MRDYQILFGTGDGNIEQTSFLFQTSGAVHTHLGREKGFFHSHNENHTEFQTLCRMYGHKRKPVLALAVVLVNIAQQRHLLKVMREEELLPLLLTFLYKGGNTVHQFLKILLSGNVLGFVPPVHLGLHTALPDNVQYKTVCIVLGMALIKRLYHLHESQKFAPGTSIYIRQQLRST